MLRYCANHSSRLCVYVYAIAYTCTVCVHVATLVNTSRSYFILPKVHCAVRERVRPDKNRSITCPEGNEINNMYVITRSNH